ncbi:MAG: histidinol-phosphate transaminase [Gammaproteobacteria bacterium]|nr:histidinol-phosphate transaminase [Pseudomonadales bacterium]MCP5346762.1 histidinol-phosphate transaminase [Pseudomonadales bacterium]
MSYERHNIESMSGYVPGEQPTAADVIKLNTNENPYPASAAVAEALAAIRVEDLRRYPSPTAQRFRQLAAAYHGLDSDNIIPTNGGDELLRLAITTFAGPGEVVGIAEPSYSLYPVLTEVQDCRLQPVPLLDDWTLPGNFTAVLNDAGARLAILVNPHAPTGMLMPAAALREIARDFHGVLVVDEAYVDFVDPPQHYDLTAAVRELDNLLLLRTLSKGFSLAGLRFGYGIGAASLLAPMMFKTRDSYNTDFIAQQLACAAIESVDQARLSWDRVRQERQRLAAELARLEMPCLPSQSNFLLAQCRSAADARSRYQKLKHDGILVRYFDQHRLQDKLRITVGTPEQNQLLLQHLAGQVG